MNCFIFTFFVLLCYKGGISLLSLYLSLSIYLYISIYLYYYPSSETNTISFFFFFFRGKVTIQMYGFMLLLLVKLLTAKSKTATYFLSMMYIFLTFLPSASAADSLCSACYSQEQLNEYLLPLKIPPFTCGNNTLGQSHL